MSLLSPLCLTHVYLNHQRNQVRKEVGEHLKKGIDDEKLVVLQFNISDASVLLRWEKDDEFEYRGSMYDVVQSDTTGPIITFWCWKDHKESAVKEQMKEWAQQDMNHSPQQRDNQKQIFHFLQSLYCQQKSDQHFSANPNLSLYPPWMESWQSVTLDPPSPPPNSAC